MSSAEHPQWYVSLFVVAQVYAHHPHLLLERFLDKLRDEEWDNEGR